MNKLCYIQFVTILMHSFHNFNDITSLDTKWKIILWRTELIRLPVLQCKQPNRDTCPNSPTIEGKDECHSSDHIMCIIFVNSGQELAPERCYDIHMS